MGSFTNQSAVTLDSPAYRKSQKDFRKNVLAMDYTDEPEGKDKVNTSVENLSDEVKKKKKKKK